MRTASSSTSTLSFTTTRRGWLQPPVPDALRLPPPVPEGTPEALEEDTLGRLVVAQMVMRTNLIILKKYTWKLLPTVPEALRRLVVLQEVIRQSLSLVLRRLLGEASRLLRYGVPVRHLFDQRRVTSGRELLGSPALLEMFRGQDGRRVALRRALMGLPAPAREWMLRLGRAYSDVRRARAARPGPARVPRASGSVWSRVPLVGVAGVALGLVVVVAVVVIAEHPLLARVVRAGQA